MTGVAGRRVRNRIAVGLVLIAALVIRLVYLDSLRDHAEFRLPALDARWFHEQALAVTEGSWEGPESTFRAPGYTLFLAAVYSVAGADPAAARSVQLLLGVLTVFLVIHLGRRLFDRASGIAAGLLAAFYWISIYFEGTLLIASLLPLLAVIVLHALLTAREKGDGRSAVVAGLSIGLFALFRPNILLFAPVAMYYLYRVRRKYRGALLCGLGVLLLVLPFTVRNRVVSGEWILLASQGGLNFYIGNHEGADGRHAVFPGLASWRNDDIERLTASRFGHIPTAHEISRYWGGEAIRTILRNPASFAVRLLQKGLYFLGGYEIGNNRDIYAFRASNGPLSLPLPGWSILLPLAVAGSLLRWKGRRDGALPELFIFVYALSVVLFFVCARFRVPVLPALFPLAGAGLTSLAGMASRPRKFAFSLAAVTGATLLLAADPFGMRQSTEGQESFHRGNVMARAGRPADAIDAYREAIEHIPRFPGVYYHLGVVLLGEGAEEEGLAQLATAERLDPGNPKILVTVAAHHAARGRFAEAESIYREAIDADPYYPDSYVNLGGMLAGQGRTAEGESILRGAGELFPDDAICLLNLGKLLVSTGRSGEAIPLLERAIESDPGRGDLRFELGNALVQMGEFDRGADAFRQAAALDGEDILCRLNLSVALINSGDKRGAAEALRDVLRLDPENSKARGRLTALGY